MDDKINLITNELMKVIKSLDEGKMIDNNKSKIIKEFIENQTNYSFDSKDSHWNKFVIRYSRVLCEIIPYNQLIQTAFISYLIFYSLLVFFYNSFSSFSTYNLSYLIFNKSTFFTFFINFVRYFMATFILMRYVTPLFITYYTLDKEINLLKIIFKSLKQTKLINFVFFVCLFSSIILYL